MWLNEDNPLTLYKRRNHKEWVEIAKETSLSVSTLIRIAMKNKNSITKTTYDSVNKIKNILGIDIINDWI